MYSDFEYRNRAIVGLIIIFALLFFCSYMALQNHEAKETARIEAEQSVEQEKEEPQEPQEPENLIDSNKPMIALTFDDGPGKYTMQLLKQLEKYGARATFFMVGTNVSNYSETVKKMKEIGCELGNHTTHHARLTELEVAEIHTEIGETNQAIQDVVGEPATLVRPPYGAVNEVVEATVGAPLAMWSVDTRDWETKEAPLVRDYVLQTVKDGDIVLLHDIHETTVQAAIELIPALVNKGYQLVTVSELAQARGIVLENGVRYYSFR